MSPELQRPRLLAHSQTLVLYHLLQESVLEMARTEKLTSDGCSGGEVEVEVELGMGVDGKGIIECRICQEEGEEAAMDSPCACAGTLKVRSPLFLSLSLLPYLPLKVFFFVWMLELR